MDEPGLEEGNPFRVGGEVLGEHFTDRGYEVELVLGAMRGGERLLVTGSRRMGKSAVIGRAAERLEGAGGVVVTAELGTASSLLDVVDRLLGGVARVEPWRARLVEWTRALAPMVRLGFDAAGEPQLSVGTDVRPRRAEAERRLLEGVVDRVESLAEGGSPVVVVLEEFQRISELGGEPAERLLRDRMQENRATAFVCTASDEDAIGELLQPTRAFYRFFERIRIGLIDPDHMGRWIDARLTETGVRASGVGARLVSAVGPRTHDIVRGARILWFQRRAEGTASAQDVDAAVAEIVTQCDPAFRRSWEQLTPLQQRLLRALAEGARELHSTNTRGRYGLGASSSVTTALTALVSQSHLSRSDGELTFDDPYCRDWVLRELAS